jgi:hypothetical protein
MTELRPHFVKVAHFESLALFPTMLQNEWQRKIKLRGTTYNPDYYVAETDLYIEVVTSFENITEQRLKWRSAMRKANLRVFWWEGEELTELIRRSNMSPRSIVEKAKKEVHQVTSGYPTSLSDTSSTETSHPVRRRADSSGNAVRR